MSELKLLYISDLSPSFKKKSTTPKAYQTTAVTHESSQKYPIWVQHCKLNWAFLLGPRLEFAGKRSQYLKKDVSFTLIHTLFMMACLASGCSAEFQICFSSRESEY